MAKLKTQISAKVKLSSTLKGWLPLLQSSLTDLESVISKMSEDNPYINVESNFQTSLEGSLAPTKKIQKEVFSAKNSLSDKIESLSTYELSLYEVLSEQIVPPLFPSPKSQSIAFEIIDNLDEDGYLDTDLDSLVESLKVKEIYTFKEEIERIRLRFSRLTPTGIGAKDALESLIFQLDSSELEGKDYELASKILSNLQAHASYKNHASYAKVMNVIKHFKRPPAIDYKPSDSVIVPDLILMQDKHNIELRLNDAYYPNIFASKTEGIKKEVLKDAFFKSKLKEARDLIDALDMRKATLRKIGLMIIEYQYDFFLGGEIKPMKLKDIADELKHSPSTISRAIQNKFLECNRGIFPIKSFFTTAIDENTSNASIKDFLLELIKNENKKQPLSDVKILSLIEEKFNLKIVRRTITKYRKQLNIEGSSQRKKMYKIACE
ncbi:RNA polymerase factor sigma-54 [Helicobacter sp. 11S02629-2]|uniref:RNA polymerase factor sigma-54 n=1 Tax=Helicobacter sp. 11S02629-2 TaxID=1476195 RepID=UPI000BA7984F|nr:RNA polymerase factor sigma-54 [Helicobacter sp. 11S02629-2]PAF46021.1 RNA polymerase factor sigma-54 [Helicobacter sp. 11S02629-2]